MFHSNIDEFEQKLTVLSDVLRTDDGLGEQIAQAHGEMLADRCSRQVGPNGEQWRENEPAYAASKGFLPVGVLTGATLAPDALKGEAAIGEKSVTILYGGGPEEVAKLNYLAASGRVVWGLDDEMRARFRDIVTEFARGKLRR